jgi:hypothetical protein
MNEGYSPIRKNEINGEVGEESVDVRAIYSPLFFHQIFPFFPFFVLLLFVSVLIIIYDKYIFSYYL